ncbi:MAG: hypothetical protein JOZ84_11715, partial [Methylobacteriaceae bacterium]|nr:hypothetical protein [Methylobacteriaceae bacterium]
MANELLPPKVTPHKATASVHKPVLPFRIFCVFREIIALTVWLYAIVNLFVFDLDNYLVMHLAPDYAWLVNFKFVVFLAGILIFALFTRKGALLLFAGYVIAYPFILILARFPYFVYKQKSWTLFFHVVNLVVSGFRSIKYAAVSFSLYIICYTIVLAAQ